MRMGVELKPCPFCGGEAICVEVGIVWQVICRSCRAEIMPFSGKPEAIEAWNTRAERTCQIIKSRALKFWDKEVMCSECGRLWLEKGKDNYCPSCGAKVIDKVVD